MVGILPGEVGSGSWDAPESICLAITRVPWKMGAPRVMQTRLQMKSGVAAGPGAEHPIPTSEHPSFLLKPAGSALSVQKQTFSFFPFCDKEGHLKGALSRSFHISPSPRGLCRRCGPGLGATRGPGPGAGATRGPAAPPAVAARIPERACGLFLPSLSLLTTRGSRNWE